MKKSSDSAPIKKHRRNIHNSATRLRRARRLYVFLCRHALATDQADAVMRHMTRKMWDRELYARTSGPLPVWREYRFRILRYLWKIEGNGCDWHFWYARRFDHNFNLRSKENAA